MSRLKRTDKLTIDLDKAFEVLGNLCIQGDVIKKMVDDSIKFKFKPSKDLIEFNPLSLSSAIDIIHGIGKSTDNIFIEMNAKRMNGAYRGYLISKQTDGSIDIDVFMDGDDGLIRYELLKFNGVYNIEKAGEYDVSDIITTPALVVIDSITQEVTTIKSPWEDDHKTAAEELLLCLLALVDFSDNYAEL